MMDEKALRGGAGDPDDDARCRCGHAKTRHRAPVFGRVDHECTEEGCDCKDFRYADTTETGQAWRDEYCPNCRGNRQYHRDLDGGWRCVYCHNYADAHTARRLDAAESNLKKQNR